MSSNSKDGDPPGFEQATRGAQGESHVEASPARARRPPSPRNCREFIRREAAEAMPDIVLAFVQRAKDGSVPHFASLAKVGGFDQRPSAADTPVRRRKSLARQLLDEVESYEAKRAAELESANAEASRIGNQIDNSNRRP